MNWSKYFLWPLKSRKVHVALATLISAWVGAAGLNLSDTVIASIVTIGISVILGIAGEDAGTKAAGGTPAPPV